MTDWTEEQSRSYDAGNYASAYISEDFDYAWESDGEPEDMDRDFYMLGFFSSFELHEVPGDLREEVATIRDRVGDDF